MNRRRASAILGISAFYHDSAAALVVDGRIVAAAQEERFTRRKHDHRFPSHAIAYCLEEGGLTVDDLDFVGFYEKPLVKFDRLLETYLTFAPAGLGSFVKAMPLWAKEKLFLAREIRRGLGQLDGGFGGRYRRRLIYPEHHESHAASAFFPSPFEQAAILTIDGVGEWATASVGVGRGHRVELLEEMHFPHSLGLLYSAFTYFCGFKVNSGEYKLMGLAPYGEPRYVDVILEKLVDLKSDGSLRMDMRYFNYCQGLTMTNGRFAALFGGPPRRPESRLTRREMDLAASVQKVTELAMMRMAAHAHAVTGLPNLCLAGGCALNCVANGHILRDGPFENVWIQPAAGDAGGALGTALLIWHQLLDHPRVPQQPDGQHGSLLGPRLRSDEVEAFLRSRGAVYQRLDDDALLDRVAGLLTQQKVVGWVQGRMEFGPRALGGRSILGDARSPAMQSVMNRKIKFRESFRPFAPSVLREHADEYFDLDRRHDSPYMLLVAPVSARQRRNGTHPQPFTTNRGREGAVALIDGTRVPPVIDVGRGDRPAMKKSTRPSALGDAPDADDDQQMILRRLAAPRSTVPAITHVDDSARVQTVDAQRHGRYHELIRRFHDATGCPVLINTSFNVRGEPIVCTAADAYQCFMATDMDALVIEDCLLLKEQQHRSNLPDRQAYLDQFSLD